jgi:hypothetical protein
MREVYIFDRKGIEDFINNKEDTTEYKRVFEKCGMFLSDNYIIYSDEYDSGSPLENLQKFLESKFGEYALEDFYDISYKKLVMEIYIEDLKKDEELLEEIESEKKLLEDEKRMLEEKMQELNKKEAKIKRGER